jgi:hypothetical protein
MQFVVEGALEKIDLKGETVAKNSLNEATSPIFRK